LEQKSNSKTFFEVQIDIETSTNYPHHSTD
jgi:hypothetical protein